MYALSEGKSQCLHCYVLHPHIALELASGKHSIHIGGGKKEEREGGKKGENEKEKNT